MIDATPAFVVAVCTRQRPCSLERLIGWLAKNQWPTESRLLIVDNDIKRAAEQASATAQASLPVPVDYIVEPRPGFASARNAALTTYSAFGALAFVDDDAIVPTDWVAQMHRTHTANPHALVRSHYAHVIDLPTDTEQMSVVTAALPPLSSLQPAGTSGLLLPQVALDGQRFDPYFDSSGGEDVDLLLRLERQGVTTVLADTIVLEQHRVGVASRRTQLDVARWNGRMATLIRQRNNLPTAAFRGYALFQAILAGGRAAIRELLGQRDAATAHLSFAVGRLATATAPMQLPAALGPRPQG